MRSSSGQDELGAPRSDTDALVTPDHVGLYESSRKGVTVAMVVQVGRVLVIIHEAL